MMGILYYFAMTFDGYIARANHKVDWLEPYFCEFNTPYELPKYIAGIDG